MPKGSPGVFRRGTSLEANELAKYRYAHTVDPLVDIAKDLEISLSMLCVRIRGWYTKEERKPITAHRKSENHKGLKNPGYGKPLTPEAKERLRIANLNKVISPETRAKIAKSNTGKKRTPEQVERIAAANRAHVLSDKGRAGIVAARKCPVWREKISALGAKRMGEFSVNPSYLKSGRGTYICRKGSNHRYDSGWELTRMQQLDALDYAWSKHHGTIIPYINVKGDNRRYVPDFLVTDTASGVTWIEEVKGYLTPNDEQKHAFAKVFCAAKGWDFTVLDKEHFVPRKRALAVA